MTSLQSAIDALTAKGCKPTPSGAGYTAYCPVHESDHNGHKPSLSFAQGDKQSIVLICHAGCSYPDIMAALGLEKPGPVNGQRRIVATYSYRDATGATVFEKVRYEPKDFRIRHRPEPGADWVWKKPQLPEYPLYRLPELRAGIAAGETVWVCEGEKDCDRLAAIGLCATCNSEGAEKPNQKAKWRREYTTQLAGAARAVLLPDNDEPGRAHMAHIATQLRGKVGDVRMLTLPGLSGAKGDNDVSDWLNKGHTVEELRALAESAGRGDDREPGADDEPATAPAPAPEKPSIWIRGSTLLKKQFADPAWILPDILPDSGLFLLSGKPKSGKSWLALALAMAVAQFGVCLDRAVAGGRVLYLALEDNQRRLKERMLKLQPDVAGDPDQLSESAFATEFPRLGAGAEPALEKALSAGGVRLVVIDTLQKIRAVGGAANQYESDYLAISALKRLADQYGVCVLVIHHTRKMDADDIHDSVSGTLGLTGAADGSLVLVRQRGDGAAVLAVTGRDMPDNEFGLRFEGGLWTFVGKAEEVRASAEQNAIIEALKPYGGHGATTAELAKEIGKNQQTLRFLLRKLVDKQLVRVRNAKPAPFYAVCDGPAAAASGCQLDHAGKPISTCATGTEKHFTRWPRTDVHGAPVTDMVTWRCATCGQSGEFSNAAWSAANGVNSVDMNKGEKESSGESEETANGANGANATNATNGAQNTGSVSGVSLESDPPLTVQRPVSVDSEKSLESTVSSVSGVSGVSAKSDLTQSPTASRIRDCLAGDLAGMAEDVLIKTVCGKAGPALTQTTINALLLAGQMSRVNGRLVLAGGGV